MSMRVRGVLRALDIDLLSSMMRNIRSLNLANDFLKVEFLKQIPWRVRILHLQLILFVKLLLVRAGPLVCRYLVVHQCLRICGHFNNIEV